MILTDLLQVIYAPKKAFKNIVANPKYLAVVIVLVLFMGLMIGFEYAQFTKTSLEVTSPVAGIMQSYNNATNWVGSTNVVLTNNFADYYNNTVYVAELQVAPNDAKGYYPLFGNFSMQIQANNTNSVIVALSNTSNVDCTPGGFQNLSITLKLIEPPQAPQNATLTLYSLSDTDFYTYDLTSMLADANAVNQWGNLTVPLGPNAEGWTATGNPQWTNITALTMQFNYAENQDVTIRLGALFFRGQYMQPVQYDIFGLLGFLQVFSLQFLFTWLVLTAVAWIIFRALKNPVVWKPIFIAFGCTLMVMVIRGLVNIIATAAIPAVYYPYDVALGLGYNSFMTVSYPAGTIGNLTAQSMSTLALIDSSLEVFRGIVTGMFVVSYFWLGALCTLVLKELKPEFSLVKCIGVAGVAVGVTLLTLFLFIGVI
ncbi:MAG: hypothetical protein NWE93_10630 [Candidatus Bathyarchaeota archaeon]|nr:hypothetical protein [Candidatus Bathyarchaeota archaeon]